MSILVKMLVVSSFLCCSFSWVHSDAVIDNEDERAAFKAGRIRYTVAVKGDEHLSVFAEESYIDLYINESNSKLEFNLFEGLANLQVLQLEGSSTFQMLFDIPTIVEKTVVGVDEKQFSLVDLDDIHENKAPAAVYQSFKKIEKRAVRVLGHKCYKVEKKIGASEEGDCRLILTMASKLKVETALPFSNYLDDLEGIPLEIEIHYPPLIIKMRASSITKQHVKDVFFEIPENYQRKTKKELKQHLEHILDQENSPKKSIGL